MKKHIVQRGIVQCRRDFCVEGDIGNLSNEQLGKLADDAEVEWAIDESIPLHVEQFQIQDADPTEDFDCPELLFGGVVQVEAVETGGNQTDHKTVLKDSDQQ